ncbi:MAG: ABC transporter ATP-binding protein [Lachnospiraceae bacterium]|nr:ABC transporter ATP-binding protein [Lachnospiraceae bacterium]
MLLTIKDLQVRYGNQIALQIDRPIEIREGERIGIIGSNGAGKTTLVKAVLGLTHYKGSIRTSLRPEQIAAHMQSNHYAATMPVKTIMETILDTSIRKNRELQELIKYFEFEKCLHKRYTHLSGGQKQRFTIIMVMLQNAPLTFYDEVTSGLDFETRQKLMERLSDWYQGRSNTLCIVSHYYEELEMLAEKILILDQGKVIDFGSKGELFQKYCGRSVIIVDNNRDNQELLGEYKKLVAPDHLLAVSCPDLDAEQRLSLLLLQKNVNFKRSDNDIEIMSTNAKAAYYGKEELQNES